MNTLYFTPGPTQLYPTVKKHIQQALKDDIPSLSHRSDTFHTIVKETYTDLRRLLTIPAEYEIFFVASATEAMERVIQNCAGENTIHFVNGAFSKRFYEMAKQLKKSPELVEVEPGVAFNFKDVNQAVKPELICFTHNETSGGTAIPLEEIYTFAKRYPNALTAIDIVSSAPYIDVDIKKMDCIFFSVQKGFGLPAGLGVLIVSPRALKKAAQLQEEGYNVGSYHRFETLHKQAKKYQTIETPNVLAIYLLHKVLQDMLAKGIATIRQETVEKAELLYQFFSKSEQLKPYVNNEKWRSETVIVVSTPKGSKGIVAKLKEKGFIVGAGYGDMKEKQIRIANFPTHSIQNVKSLLATIKKM